MPGIDFSHAPAWLQWVIAAIAVFALVAAVIGFVRKGWPVLSQFVSTINSLAALPHFIEEQDDFRANINKTIQAMNHELSPNGGSSLVDRSKRNEAAIGELLADTRHIKAQVSSVKTTIARTDKKLTDHLNESAVILEHMRASGQLPQPKGTK